MIRYLLIYLAVINLVELVLFRIDKSRAQHNGEVEKNRRRRKPQPEMTEKRRIPEKTLFVVAALGGSIGAIVGMWAFRHKTKHRTFVYGMPAVLAAQLVIAWAAVKGI